MFCAKCGTRVAPEAVQCTLCGTLLPGHDASELRTPDSMLVLEPVRYGGFWRRFVALLLDTLVLYFPAATIRVLLGLPAVNLFNTINVDSSATMLASSLELFIDWFYAVLFVTSPARATLGMMVMDLQLTGLAGERVSFARATGRYFAQFLTIATVGIGYVIQPFTSRRQTLHDMLSSTVVVRPAPAPAPLGMPAIRTMS